MACVWLEEYSMRAATARVCKISLDTLRAEYIHRYNRLLDRKQQPHSDFFTNLSLEENPLICPSTTNILSRMRQNI